MNKNFSLMRSATMVSIVTLVSRVFGFVRDVMIATILGAGFSADIFFVVLRLPNLFRRLFAEGAFNAAFSPMFSHVLEQKGLVKAKQLSSEIMSVFLCGMVVFTCVAEVFMPQIIYLLAEGFVTDTEKFNLTVTYARITFPYLLLISFMSFFVAMLNVSGRFFITAFVPIIFNTVLIMALLIASLTHAKIVPYLVWGMLAAGGIQFTMVWIVSWRCGLHIVLKKPRVTPNIRRFFTLFIPGVLAASIGQINIFIGTNIASAQAGATSWLYYADRLYQLPLGVIGVALSVVLLPDLSRRLQAGDFQGARNSQNRSVEMALFLCLPASIGLYILAEAMVTVLFERGAFTVQDTQASALALKAFSLGLLSFILIKVLQSSFFAKGDTKTPLLYGSMGVICNIMISLIFFPIYGHVAIAIATSVAGWVTVITMIIHLTFIGWQGDKRLLRISWRVVIASFVMGLFLYFTSFKILELNMPHFIGLSVHLLGGLFVYLCVSFLLGIMRIMQFKNMYRVTL